MPFFRLDRPSSLRPMKMKRITINNDAAPPYPTPNLSHIYVESENMQIFVAPSSSYSSSILLSAAGCRFVVPCPFRPPRPFFRSVYIDTIGASAILVRFSSLLLPTLLSISSPSSSSLHRSLCSIILHCKMASIKKNIRDENFKSICLATTKINRVHSRQSQSMGSAWDFL